mgnify:CR=1 FL=1
MIADKYISLLVALIGSLGSASIGLIFPPMLEILTLWPDRSNNRFYWLSFSKDMIIMLLGIAQCAIGTVTSVVALINSLAGSGIQVNCPI